MKLLAIPFFFIIQIGLCSLTVLTINYLWKIMTPKLKAFFEKNSSSASILSKTMIVLIMLFWGGYFFAIILALISFFMHKEGEGLQTIYTTIAIFFPVGTLALILVVRNWTKEQKQRQSEHEEDPADKLHDSIFHGPKHG